MTKEPIKNANVLKENLHFSVALNFQSLQSLKYFRTLSERLVIKSICRVVSSDRKSFIESLKINQINSIEFDEVIQANPLCPIDARRITMIPVHNDPPSSHRLEGISNRASLIHAISHLRHVRAAWHNLGTS